VLGTAKHSLPTGGVRTAPAESTGGEPALLLVLAEGLKAVVGCPSLRRGAPILRLPDVLPALPPLEGESRCGGEKGPLIDGGIGGQDFTSAAPTALLFAAAAKPRGDRWKDEALAPPGSTQRNVFADQASKSLRSFACRASKRTISACAPGGLSSSCVARGLNVISPPPSQAARRARSCAFSVVSNSRRRLRSSTDV